MRLARLLSVSFVAAFVFTPITAFAKDIYASSKVVAVTVFPSGAQVTREVRASFEEGVHKLIVGDLPAELRSQTLRIRGEGPVDLVLGSIDHKVITSGDDGKLNKSERAQLLLQLEGLKDKLALARGDIEAAELQKKLLSEMVYIPSRQNRKNEAGVQGRFDQYSELYGLMGQKYKEAIAAIVKARQVERSLRKEITSIKDRLAEKPKKVKKNTQLSVNVQARNGGSGDVRFLVSYQIKGASWWPIYDARLTSANGKKAPLLQLIRRAGVKQRTSENWDNVSLTLSSVNPNGRTQAPDMHLLLVDYKKEVPPPVIGLREQEKRYQGYARSEDRAERKVRTLKLAKPAAPIRRRQAVVNSGRYQLSFSVDGLVSVKRDGTQKKVLLDVMTMAPEVRLITAPKLSAKAYVHAVVKNKSDDPIIRGKVSLFRDGVYVGQSYMKLIEPGSELKLGFGEDPKVSVKWAKLDRVKGETGLITTSNSDVRRYKITINNGHEQTIPITVFDHMPYSEKEDLSVALLAKSVKPTRQNVDDKRGVLAWDRSIAGGASQTIQFGYQIIWPKEKKISIQRR